MGILNNLKTETMTNSIKYFAFQDTGIGLIQWVGAGKDKIGVLSNFKKDVGFDQTPEKMLGDLEATEITFEQYNYLKELAGDNQDAINLLESWK